MGDKLETEFSFLSIFLDIFISAWNVVQIT